MNLWGDPGPKNSFPHNTMTTYAVSIRKAMTIPCWFVFVGITEVEGLPQVAIRSVAFFSKHCHTHRDSSICGLWRPKWSFSISAFLEGSAILSEGVVEHKRVKIAVAMAKNFSSVDDGCYYKQAFDFNLWRKGLDLVNCCNWKTRVHSFVLSGVLWCGHVYGWS